MVTRIQKIPIPIPSPKLETRDMTFFSAQAPLTNSVTNPVTTRDANQRSDASASQADGQTTSTTMAAWSDPTIGATWKSVAVTPRVNAWSSRSRRDDLGAQHDAGSDAQAPRTVASRGARGRRYG